MQRSLNADCRKIVTRISDCIARLTNFSNDILEFSRSKILKDKKPLDLISLIKSCIEIHFFSIREKFTLIVEQQCADIFINGDRGKLEQVFINIFKNSIEAKAEHIIITLVASETMILCKIDDDGIGCSQEQLSQIFKSFYTTKKNEGGTGLGMCVVRSIVEVHGGHISAYTKNVIGNGTHGLSFHITFPGYDAESSNPEIRYNVILIKKDIKDPAFLFRVFQNINIQPHVVQNVNEIDQKLIETTGMKIFASPSQLSLLNKREKLVHAYAIVEGADHDPFIVNDNGKEHPVAFCEEQLMSIFST